MDCALLPHAYRYFALGHYRGSAFAVPRDEGLEPFHAWLHHMEARAPGVAATLPGRGRYLEHVGKYASGRARSKVAQAVRSGSAAHDMK